MVRIKWTLFIIYLFIAFYFLNLGWEFFKIPEVISNFDKWILTIGAILIIFEGLSLFRSKKSINLL
ncbi:MAG: hypothetical protein ABH811_00600 [archaeon]